MSEPLLEPTPYHFHRVLSQTFPADLHYSLGPGRTKIRRCDYIVNLQLLALVVLVPSNIDTLMAEHGVSYGQIKS